MLVGSAEAGAGLMKTYGGFAGGVLVGVDGGHWCLMGHGCCAVGGLMKRGDSW